MNFSFPQMMEVVSKSEKPAPKAVGTITVILLRELLGHVKTGGYLGEDVMKQCDSVLRSLEPAEEDENEDKWLLDYKSKELIDIRNQYQAVASEVSNFVIGEGK